MRAPCARPSSTFPGRVGAPSCHRAGRREGYRHAMS
jgi:hypothetical protein